MIDLDSPKLVVARTEFKLRMSRLMRELGVEDAPYDDEPLSAEDVRGIARGVADVAAGRVYSQEEVGRELGLLS